MNAHPHLSEDGRLAVIHNGIIENFAELRDQPQLWRCQVPQRDGHRGAHLLAVELRDSADLTEAMQRTCQQLRGAFTWWPRPPTIPTPWWVHAATPRWSWTRRGRLSWPPMSLRFIAHTRSAMELGQDQVITITRDGVEITDFEGGPAKGESSSR